MTTNLDDIKQGAALLVSQYAERDSQGEEMRRMFHMEWSDAPAQDWIKATMSPSAYNAVMGFTRIMTSTNPAFSVPFDESDSQGRQQSEKLERAAKALWAASGRATDRPAHYDLILSAALFGEMAGGVTATADLLDHAKASKDKRNIARMTALAHHTPYIFESYNPLTCYPDRDRFGLRGLLRRTLTTWGEVQDEWGALTEGIEWGNDRSEPARREPVTLCDWYDWGQRAVWLDGRGTGAILHEDHELPFLPVVAGISEGTNLFSEPHLQRYPLLYGMLKSGLWKRENLSLTMIYSLVYALGTSPLLVYKSEEEGGNLVIDRSLPAGIVHLKKDESLEPLAQKILDPSQTYGLELAQGMNEESTISKMALGAPPDNALAFSAINTLVQSGRLPLMGVKEMGGKVIGKEAAIALQWIKFNGGEGNKIYSERGEYVELKRDDIPDKLVINVGLEPDLPTDKLNLANIAKNITEGDNPLASKRWARENIMNIGQSDTMEQEIWAEKRAAFEMVQLLQARAAEAQLKMQEKAQAAARAAAAQQGGGGTGMPGGAPGAQPGGAGTGQPGMPPGVRADVYPPGGQVTEGAPLSGPLPPRDQQG